MTQDSLLLIGSAVIAGYMARLALKLAPPLSEFPLKTLLASLLSAAVALADVLPYSVDQPLRLFMLVAGPLYAFGPLAAVGLSRLRRYRAAVILLNLLYWTSEGRSAVRRLPAQVALQQGDADVAAQLIPAEDSVMIARALALTGQWQRILELDLPSRGDKAYLGDDARVEALLQLGRAAEAQRVLEGMRQRWEAGPQGPLGYRSIRLSEARVASEQGDLGALRELLGQPLSGVAAHQVLALLARGAERADRRPQAEQLYRDAFTAAPPPFRERYSERLRELGAPPPDVVARPRAPLATWLLGAGLVLAYLVQVWLDGSVGPFVAAGSSFKASTLAAAFLLGLPALPEADAWWRYLSYSLVHGNLLHIGFNVWVLVDVGRLLESRRGWQDLITAFVVGTAAGALLTVLVDNGSALLPLALPQSQPLVLVGASGGVLGVAGSLLASALATRQGPDRALAAGLLRWVGLIVLLSLAIPNVSLWGHVGGVAGGLAWGFLRRLLPAAKVVDVFIAGAAAALLLLALTRAAELAFRLAAL